MEGSRVTETLRHSSGRDAPFALVVSEPLRARMAGIGIRYVEIARRLTAEGIPVRMISPPPEAGSRFDPRAGVGSGGDGLTWVPFVRQELAQQLRGCRGVLAQGQLGNDVVSQASELPVAFDFYDPWLVENFHYTETLGLEPWRNDHATWMLQLARGDFFLCSSDEQRRFYLGFLTALGRVNPHLARTDPGFRRLIDTVPFGLARDLPEHRRYLDERSERVLLFGGLYDWYDPHTVLDALLGLRRDDLRLLVVANPNVESTPQRRLEEVRARMAREPRLAAMVEILDWVPFERRFDLLRDVDLMVGAWQPGIETELSLRTRFLEALRVGCPVVTTRGGALGRLLDDAQTGWQFAAGDVRGLTARLAEVLAGGAQVEARTRKGEELAATLSWEAVLEPLVRFAQEPWVDTTRQDFTVSPGTAAPADAASFRLRRFLTRISRRFSRARGAV